MKEQQPLGFIIKQINNIYEKELTGRLKMLGITSSQCAVLNYLFQSNQEHVTQRELEKQLNLKNPTVTGLLKRLDEKGFLFCVQSTSDKRCKNIYLTEKAFDIQKKMESDRKKLDKRLTIGMTKKEEEALRRGLSKVLYNISEP